MTTTSFRILLCALAILLAGSATAFAADEPFERVRNPQPPITDGPIEVIELFWYGCPHCYALEPYLEKWLENKPDDVRFVRVPGVLNGSWVPHARAFYTAQKLGVLEQVHQPLFNALHQERKAIFSQDDLRDFFKSRGIDADDFDRVYDSHEVDIRVKQALSLAKGYRITGVPALIVNGKYLTNGSLAGTYQGMVDAVDLLVQRERSLLAGSE